MTIVPVPLERRRGLPLGRREQAHLDAVCLTAERGSFLTLLHPAFSVAVPHPLEIRLPLAYPVARHDLEMARFLGTLDRPQAQGRHDPGPLRPLDPREGREGPAAALVDPARRAGLGALSHPVRPPTSVGRRGSRLPGGPGRARPSAPPDLSLRRLPRCRTRWAIWRRTRHGAGPREPGPARARHPRRGDDRRGHRDRRDREPGDPGTLPRGAGELVVSADVDLFLGTDHGPGPGRLSLLNPRAGGRARILRHACASRRLLEPGAGDERGLAPHARWGLPAPGQQGCARPFALCSLDAGARPVNLRALATEV